VIAPARARRPGAARARLEEPTVEALESCPFCAGHEDMTPPETLRIPKEGDWQVRVVPNLYPAFERQEVVVHTPRHVLSLADLTGVELDLVAEAWRLRAEAAEQDGLGYVQALVNEGREAGASLSHTHSQLVWLAGAPPLVALERSGGTCRLCELLAEELDAGERVVFEDDGLVLVCPKAGRAPYELLLAPRQHEADGFASELLGRALALLAEALRRVRALEGAVPANAWLHTAPFGESGHWHIEILPRLTILAGLELGAGIYLNTLPPEAAASSLRAATG
jgi:UDPglucose--hexose-1-phosphate uridylyltransferase